MNLWGTLTHTNNTALSCSRQFRPAVSATWTATNFSRRTAWFGCLCSVGNMATVCYLIHVGRWPWTAVPVAMCDVLTGSTANICVQLQVASAHCLSLKSNSVLCCATLCPYHCFVTYCLWYRNFTCRCICSNWKHVACIQSDSHCIELLKRQLCLTETTFSLEIYWRIWRRSVFCLGHSKSLKQKLTWIIHKYPVRTAQ